MAGKRGSGRGGGTGKGMPKGYKAPATLDRLERREYLRQRVLAELGPMLDAQIDHAKGVKHLMLRDEKGSKFERVVDELQIDAAVATGRSFWVYTKDPSIQAFTDLVNRTLDKPADHVEMKVTDERKMSDHELYLQLLKAVEAAKRFQVQHATKKLEP